MFKALLGSHYPYRKSYNRVLASFDHITMKSMSTMAFRCPLKKCESRNIAAVKSLIQILVIFQYLMLSIMLTKYCLKEAIVENIHVHDEIVNLNLSQKISLLLVLLNGDSSYNGYIRIHENQLSFK